MTIEEKRAAMREFCRENLACHKCKLQEIKRQADIKCGMGWDWETLPEDKVVIAYDYIFSNAETKTKSIKDSGDRREFKTGAVRDMAEGKGRMDLLPWAAIIEVAKHCENGAKKYGEHNVDRGIPTHSFIDSAFRHLAKFTEGWTDEPHLIAAAWNILWAIQTEIKHPELIDIPWKGAEEDD